MNVSKKAFVIITYAMSIASASGQTSDIFNFASSNQSIVDDALAGSTMLLERSYRLKDLLSGQLFGLDGKDFFGTTKSVAIKTELGLIVTDRTIKPWNFDDKFQRIKGKYDVQNYKITLHDNGKAIEYDSLNITLSDSLSNIYIVKDSLYDLNNALQISSSISKKEGWLVWYYEDAKTSVSKTIIRYTYPEDGLSVIKVEKPNISNRLLGGMFVTSEQMGIGKMNFFLSGVLVNNDNSWELHQCTKQQMCDAKKDADTENVHITPIHELSKNKKKSKKK